MTNPLPVPTNPDGTPNLGGIITSASANQPDGSLSIWGLPDVLQTANPVIWYDTRKTPAQPAHEPTGVTGGAGYGGVEEGQYNAPTKATSKQVMASPVDIMKQMYALSANDPQGFVALQSALASGPWGTVHVNGVMDGNTESALSNALYQYWKLSHGAGVGMDFQQYIMQFGQRAQTLDPQNSGTYTQPQQISVSDPTQIRAAAQSAAEQALGRGLSDKQLNLFVQQFQAQQAQAETSTAGTVSAPDLSAQAMQFAQQENPGAYQGQKAQSYMNAFLNLFLPSGSQRPTMNSTPEA